MVKRTIQLLGGLVLAIFLSVGINSSAGGRELPSQEATAWAEVSEGVVEGSPDTVYVFPTATIVLEPTVTSTVTVTSTPEPTPPETPTQVPTATLEAPITAQNVCLSYTPVGNGLRKSFGNMELLLSLNPAQHADVPVCEGKEPNFPEGPNVLFYLEGFVSACVGGEPDCIAVALKTMNLSFQTDDSGYTFGMYLEENTIGADRSRVPINYGTVYFGEDGPSLDSSTAGFLLYKTHEPRGLTCPHLVNIYYLPTEMLSNLLLRLAPKVSDLCPVTSSGNSNSVAP